MHQRHEMHLKDSLKIREMDILPARLLEMYQQRETLARKITQGQALGAHHVAQLLYDFRLEQKLVGSNAINGDETDYEPTITDLHPQKVDEPSVSKKPKTAAKKEPVNA